MSNLAPINDELLKIFDEICEERFEQLDLDCLLVTIIDNVPSDALPHLAEQYHITGNEGWVQSQSDSEKRALIKSAIKMHRYKGTKYAIKEVLKTLDVNGEVSEWFEYNGEPYFFKVILEVFNRPISPKTETDLRDLINEYKNERSWLESIQMNLGTNVAQKAFIGCVFNESLAIKAKEVE